MFSWRCREMRLSTGVLCSGCGAWVRRKRPVWLWESLAALVPNQWGWLCPSCALVALKEQRLAAGGSG